MKASAPPAFPRRKRPFQELLKATKKHGDVDSSTKRGMRIQPAHGNVDSSTELVLQINKTSRLTETSIPVRNLYYKSMKILPAHDNGDSSTSLVLQIDENPAST